MTKPLGVAIAGLGRLGRRHAQHLLRNVHGCRLLAAASPVAEERQWALDQGVLRVHEDLDPLLQDDEIGAVVLVTPTSLHARQSLAVLRSGRHLFVEKPLALNIADCEQVTTEAARHPKQVTMVGFVRRFDMSYLHAWEQVQAGTIGRPFLVRSQTCDQVDHSGYFVRFSASSGGLFMDCSIHDIDVARWFFGAPKALTAYADGLCAVHPELAALTPPDIDNGVAMVAFEGQRQGAFYASRTFTLGNEISTEIIGDEGKLTIGVGAARDRVVIGDHHGVRHLAVGDFFERFSQAFITEMQAFIDACRGEAPSPLSMNDALEATRIGLALTQSYKTHQVVNIA